MTLACRYNDVKCFFVENYSDLPKYSVGVSIILNISQKQQQCSRLVTGSRFNNSVRQLLSQACRQNWSLKPGFQFFSSFARLGKVLLGSILQEVVEWVMKLGWWAQVLNHYSISCQVYSLCATAGHSNIMGKKRFFQSMGIVTGMGDVLWWLQPIVIYGIFLPHKGGRIVMAY